MQKVYMVWFINENGKNSLWGVYADESKAEEVARYVFEEFGFYAWCTDEQVL